MSQLLTQRAVRTSTINMVYPITVSSCVYAFCAHGSHVCATRRLRPTDREPLHVEEQLKALALRHVSQQLLGRAVKVVVLHAARGSGGTRGTHLGRKDRFEHQKCQWLLTAVL